MLGATKNLEIGSKISLETFLFLNQRNTKNRTFSRITKVRIKIEGIFSYNKQRTLQEIILCLLIFTDYLR